MDTQRRGFYEHGNFSESKGDGIRFKGKMKK